MFETRDSSGTYMAKAVKWAALEAASSSTRGRGWAPTGPASPLRAPSQPELSGAPLRGTGAELGHCQGGTLIVLRHVRVKFGQDPVGVGWGHGEDLARLVRVRLGLGLGQGFRLGQGLELGLGLELELGSGSGAPPRAWRPPVPSPSPHRQRA